MNTRRDILLRMIARGTLLLAVGAGPYDRASNGRVPDADDIAACRFLAAFQTGAADRGVSPVANLVVAGAAFDTDGDGVADRLGVQDQGTAHFEQAIVIRHGAKPEELGGPGQDGVGEEVRWARGVRWLIHNRRAYTVRFAGNGLGYPLYLGLHNLDGNEHPICRFQPKVEKRLVAESPEEQGICDAIEDNKVKFIAPESERNDDSSGTWRVDFTNEGRSRKTRIAMMDISAGAGCSQRVFEAVDRPDSPAARLLREAQGRFGAPNCWDDDPRWFRFEGKTYLESRSQSPDAPHLEDQEKHTVHIIERGTARLICRAWYDYGPPQLTGIWNGSGWRAP
ncbi:hypothetical protein [Sphingosinicella sp.]|jgi:hypothetical protein|uniref:hypothetical protein n=1 Tax=Sphingosinicella sp. TaxID=1917971 RepID=UPI0035B407C2